MIINPKHVGHKNITIEERFWSKVDIKSDNECWEWLGTKNKRYGTFRLPSGGRGDSKVPAHRYSYFLATKHFPESKEYVCHKCDFTFCVNPNHLFLGTQDDNMKDMVKKGRSARHKGVDNGRSKLTEKDVYEIRRLFACGISAFKLSKMFKIGKTQTYRILRNTSWSWLE